MILYGRLLSVATGSLWTYLHVYSGMRYSLYGGGQRYGLAAAMRPCIA